MGLAHGEMTAHGTRKPYWAKPLYAGTPGGVSGGMLSGGDGRWRRHVIVVAAVLVVVPDQQRALPAGAVDDRVDDPGGEVLPDCDVLRVLLGSEEVVRLDEREAWQFPAAASSKNCSMPTTFVPTFLA